MIININITYAPTVAIENPYLLCFRVHHDRVGDRRPAIHNNNNNNVYWRLLKRLQARAWRSPGPAQTAPGPRVRFRCLRRCRPRQRGACTAAPSPVLHKSERLVRSPLKDLCEMVVAQKIHTAHVSCAITSPSSVASDS
jgi:hypothetical protein